MLHEFPAKPYVELEVEVFNCLNVGIIRIILDSGLRTEPTAWQLAFHAQSTA